MSIVECIEQQILQLGPEELAELRAWFHAHEWQVWDAKIERETEGGKLDALARAALQEHAAGGTKPL